MTDPSPDWGLRLKYQTPADPELLHQVIFLMPNTSGPIKVSCNCLVYNPPKGGNSHMYMGDSKDLDTARTMYNNPAYHLKPFTPEWRAKW